MFNRYYQDELQNLRELAREFSLAHPAVAPLLSGPSSDPDVERLLEGVAFLTGLLRRKIDDDFPEIIHSLTDSVFPHYLRPLPSASIVAFTPKPGLKEIVNVPAGVSLASIPVEGTRCIFRTCFDTEVHPLRITAAEWSSTGMRSARVRLGFELTGIALPQWKPGGLRMFLGDGGSGGADILMLLAGSASKARIVPVQGGEPFALGPDDLVASGFDPEARLVPFPTRAFMGYRLLQEYFFLPQKFLFFEIRGWDRWKNRGTGAAFDIVFDIENPPADPPRIRPDRFVLSAVPVVNLFNDDSDQILVDHRTERIRVRSAGKNRSHYQVYSVDRVVGFEQGSVTRKEYRPLERYSRRDEAGAVYQVIRSRSAVDDTPEVYLSFTYPPEGPPPVPETLSLTLTYTNGALPERLQLGDISQQTSDSPGILDFRNIIPPTSPAEPVLGENALWRLVSHLSVNLLSLAGADTLQELLRLYVHSDATNRAKTAASLKRIDGIQDVRVTPADRIVNGMVMRGSDIEMTVRRDHFAGSGDLWLFGAVMDAFFGVYGSLNSFTRFTIKDSISGETHRWPPRLGDRPLI